MALRETPLYTFGFHQHPDWLVELERIAKKEPWGKDHKILELYLRANFEIAQSQNKVYISDTEAYWRAGHLSTETGDPIWIKYRLNNREGKQKWVFDKFAIGLSPIQEISIEDMTVSYNPPDFFPSWSLLITPNSFEHIVDEHKSRLEAVLGKNACDNSDFLFKAIYGELELRKKDGDAIPQWYWSQYQFLLPMSITNNKEIQLVATLSPIIESKQYQVRSILPPEYAYAYARAVVKYRTRILGWMELSADVLNSTNEE